MKYLKLAGLFTIALNTAFATPFSPYADISINTHWDSQYQDMEPAPLDEMSKSSGVTNYHLAFITDAGQCTPAFAAQNDLAVAKQWGKHLTDRLQAANIQYTIAFGGASGADLSSACSLANLTQAYQQVIDTYHPSKLDFDIENGSADVQKIMSALQTIQSRNPAMGISFTLPVLPEGLVTEGQNVVKAALAAHLKFSVNIMAMDYGPSYEGPMGNYGIQAAISLFDFLKALQPNLPDASIWQQVEVTPMIGLNDVTTEQFTLKDVDTLKQFAASKSLGGLSIWSVMRDMPCADRWVSPTCSSQNLQTEPYEFEKRFLAK